MVLIFEREPVVEKSCISSKVVMDEFSQKKVIHTMATNAPQGHGRVGAVRNRDQAYNPKNRRWTKRSNDDERFLDQKADKKPFKGVRKI